PDPRLECRPARRPWASPPNTDTFGAMFTFDRIHRPSAAPSPTSRSTAQRPASARRSAPRRSSQPHVQAKAAVSTGYEDLITAARIGSAPAMIQRKCAACEDEEKKPIQTKLAIGEPNDAFEQEADRAADEVMRDEDASRARSSPIRLQRLPATHRDV